MFLDNKIREKAVMPKGLVLNYNNTMRGLTLNEIERRLGKVEIVIEGKNSAAISISDFNAAYNDLINNKLIFARHIHQYLYEFEVKDTLNLEEIKKRCQALLPEIDREKIYVCQCRIDSTTKFEIGNTELTQYVADFYTDEGIQIDMERASMAISVSVIENKIFFGVSSLEENLSKWAGGVLFYAKDASVICRAEFKLEEAVEFFKIDTGNIKNAIDLGAAPGGWSHYLATRGIEVDSVDPAALSEKLLYDNRIHHYKMTAQEFSRNHANKKYDLIVNDMKMDTAASTKIVCALSSHLRENGYIVLTLKLPKNGVWKKIEEAVTLLGEHFVNIRVRQLYYNRSEVTVCAQKRVHEI